MKSYLHTFHPDECIKILEKTTFQRPVNDRSVTYLVEQLKTNWQVNGETIILSDDGTCLDGQHRLWACVQSGLPLKSWVIAGINSEAFDTIDTGKRRSNADIVGIGFKEADVASPVRSAVGAAVTLIVACGDDGRLNMHRVRWSVTNHDVNQFLKANPDVVYCGQELYKLGKWPLPLSLAIFLHWMVRDGFPDCIDTFFSKVVTDTGHIEGSPVLHLRRKATANPKPTDFRTRFDQLAVIIKAWNAHAAGDEVRTLRYATGIEAYPTIRMRPDQKVVRRRRA